jgi:hypothetical protein
VTWHYQIRKCGDKGLIWYDIIEVYTGPNGGECDSQAPTGETPEALVATLHMMLDDAKKYPVLEDNHEP